MTIQPLYLTPGVGAQGHDGTFEFLYKSFKHPGQPNRFTSPRPRVLATGVDVAAESQCPQCVNDYLDLCTKYNTEGNAGVLVFLRFRTTRSLNPTPRFFCKDMLPLADLLLSHPDECARLATVEFSEARLRSGKCKKNENSALF